MSNNQVKQMILEKVEANSKDYIDFLREAVKIPSIYKQKEKINKMTGFMYERMRDFGLDTEMQSQDKLDSQMQKQEEKYRDLSNVIGRIKGDSNRATLILNGHMEVYPPSEDWPNPFSGELKEGRVFGTGVVDMKAGTCAMVCAANVIKEVGIKSSGDLIVLAVPNHFGGGPGVYYALKQGLSGSFAIITEPSSLRLAIAQRGAVGIRIVTKGVPAHTTGSRRSEIINAIETMAQVIPKLKELEVRFTGEQHPLLKGGPILNVESIKGGLGHTLVPDKCEIGMDIRVLPSQSPETIKADLQNLVNELRATHPDVNAQVDIDETIHIWPDGTPGLPSTSISQDERIVKLVSKAHQEVTGAEPTIWAHDGFTDAANFNRFGIPAICYGPGDAPYYWKDENVKVEDYLTAIKVYALAAAGNGAG